MLNADALRRSGEAERPQETAHGRRELLALVARCQKPDLRRSIAQLAMTLIPTLALITLMYLLATEAYWLTLLLAVPTAGLVVRLFIIQHDCGHGSYFRARWANAAVGRVCSMATLTPYAHWRRQHAGHHGVWNNLDRRESGADIYSSCLTVAEYRALSRRRRWFHRVLRHPTVALALLPPLVFLALYRLPFDTPRAWRRERASVHLTNLALLLFFAALAVLLGPIRVIAVQVPITVLAAMAGVWLFSVQHRFESSAWLRNGEWTAVGASLDGSSYLALPRVLQWFTGNIGFHHIHHLSPRIPNYRLEECHRLLSGLIAIPQLTFRQALEATRFAVWDEERKRLVSFADAAPA